MSRRRRLLLLDCHDCRVDTGDTDYYMVHDHVWQAAAHGGARILCIPCLESRLGRRLVPADFRFTPDEMTERFFLLEEDLLDEWRPKTTEERHAELDARPERRLGSKTLVCEAIQ